jgi:hypothetical protein
MSYAAFRGTNFSPSLFRGGQGKRWNGRLWFGHAEAQDYSCGKLNLISDFLQESVS